LLKVENVVSPPIIPVVRNNFSSSDMVPELTLICRIKPIRIAPLIFTINVPYGNPIPNSFRE
jgi:hypothetical protein